jgi:hypothetical protein
VHLHESLDVANIDLKFTQVFFLLLIGLACEIFESHVVFTSHRLSQRKSPVDQRDSKRMRPPVDWIASFLGGVFHGFEVFANVIYMRLANMTIMDAGERPEWRDEGADGATRLFVKVKHGSPQFTAKNSPKLAVALNCGIGSRSLNAEVNPFCKLHWVRVQSPEDRARNTAGEPRVRDASAHPIGPR